METLRALLALLVVLVVRASTEIRHPGFDVDDSRQEGYFPVDMDPDMFLQRPIFPSRLEILKLMAELEQTPPEPKKDPPVFGPRSMGPKIPFPYARPTASNIKAICHNTRPRYPKESLPRTGFGYLFRQAEAINHLESLYTTCCSNWTNDEDLNLCCAQQAWRKSLSDFCDEEFSVKTSHYYCCNKKEQERWDCFDKEAPDWSYSSSVEGSVDSVSQDFNFNPNACDKTSLHPNLLIPRVQRATTQPTSNISFPAGRPNSKNIGSICANLKHRPRYLSKCLPDSGYSWLGRQMKAINILEKGFTECCKKEKKALHVCAEKRWKKMVDIFCKAEKKVKSNKFMCCEKKKGEEQYECFATAAPNPHYHHNSSKTIAWFDMVCDTNATLLTESMSFPVDKIVEQCCPLTEEKKTPCTQTQLDNILDDICKADKWKSAKVKPKCCKGDSMGRSQCLTKQLQKIIKAKNKGKGINRKVCLFPSSSSG